MTGEQPGGGPAGWRLVLAALWAFLMPGVLAVAGLLTLPIVWPHRDSPTVGGMGGLLLGMLLAGMISRLLARLSATPAESTNSRIHESTS